MSFLSHEFRQDLFSRRDGLETHIPLIYCRRSVGFCNFGDGRRLDILCKFEGFLIDQGEGLEFLSCGAYRLCGQI